MRLKYPESIEHASNKGRPKNYVADQIGFEKRCLPMFSDPLRS
jgi:hypothetical protein